jgi:nucleoside-diphosphate-sugar epimerase
MARILVTGGSGFIGSALVKAMLKDGNAVRVLDDNSRGAPRRLADIQKDIEFVAGDIRDAATVDAAVRGVDEVHHLAFVNGTEFFYSAPELVLDVGVKGMVNVIAPVVDCVAAANRATPGAGIAPATFFLERAPLVVPDPTNARYSYGGGKIISELMAINYGRKFFDRVLIFRPHNVYGPDMGFEHVIPQFALRLKRAAALHKSGKVPFEIQGD